MLELVRRNRILLTTAFFLLLSLLLVSTAARFPDRRDPIRGVLSDALAPLQSAVSSLQGFGRQIWSGYVNLIGTARENRRLHARIADLEARLARLEDLEQSNERLSELLDFRRRLTGPALGARVIARDPMLWFQGLTIDRGEQSGVRRGMAVLSPEGVVGQVAEVSRSTARVLLLTDRNSGIDAFIQRTRARGIVQGALENGCHMKYLRHGEDVRVGDLVFTSGLDGIFPKGILIGEVTELSTHDRGLLQLAVVRPRVALDRIEEVLIVDATAELSEPPA
jgi:rod shape-determining protein MreC